MEIGSIKNFGFALVNPEFLKNSLKVWTVTVAARVIMVVRIAAIVTYANVTAKALIVSKSVPYVFMVDIFIAKMADFSNAQPPEYMIATMAFCFKSGMVEIL